MTSRWNRFDVEIAKQLSLERPLGTVELAKLLLGTRETTRENNDVHSLAKYIFRNKKHFTDDNEGIYNATESLDISNRNVKHLWVKNKEASLFVKNPDYVEAEVDELEKLQADLIESLKKYSPKFPKLVRNKNTNGHCLVVDPSDLHIGKMANSFETGEDYDNQIAVKRALDGVKGILDKVQSFHIDKILFVGGNDVLHFDNPNRTTTGGTPQDACASWNENFLIAKDLYVDILELLLSVADVHFVFNPSNHDYTNGFFLVQVIQTYFRNCKNITFDNDLRHRKYFRYFNNLIGSTHGDAGKIADLPMLMAHESKDWVDCKHKYIYTHHVHHKQSKDYMGVCVESLRSPSATDSWHHKSGYQHAPQAVEGFLHDKEHGQIARISHFF